MRALYLVAALCFAASTSVSASDPAASYVGLRYPPRPNDISIVEGSDRYVGPTRNRETALLILIKDLLLTSHHQKNQRIGTNTSAGNTMMRINTTILEIMKGQIPFTT